MKKIVFISGILVITFISISCNKKDDSETTPAFKPTPYDIEIPFGFPKNLNIPEDNPLTVEGIALGRDLFYDGRISGRTDPDSLMSCSTCHIQGHGFECGIDNPDFPEGHPHGATGMLTPHYMLPLINLVWNKNGYTWNGSISESNPDPGLHNIEGIAYLAITDPHEIKADTSKVVNAIQNIPGYPELFKEAFGSEEVTIDRISKAIAQFVRTIISSNSRFDQYLRGEIQLTPEELNGYVLFTTEEGADCFHCHGGGGNPLFTTNLCYNNAKDSVFTDPFDRYSVTGNPTDIGAYKAPTLRNIEMTSPYMHDGRFKTLDEVINFYSEGLVYTPYVNPLMHWISYGGTQLTPKEKEDLKAFLLSLTDYDLLTNPAYARPDKLPGE